MSSGERSRLCVSRLGVTVFLVVTLCQSLDALSISKREPVTEQVLVITTLPTESPLYQDETQTNAGTTPVAGLFLDAEQNDQGNNIDPVGTTVDTLILNESTGESWEVGPTMGAVKVEIGNENTNKLQAEPLLEEIKKKEDKPILPEIYSFQIESDVKYRYSRTYVTSRVANKDSKRAHEVTFSVVLPETAFISKFIMEIDGTPYEAYVKEKEEAKKDYVKAQSQGQTAGLVEKSTRNSNLFNVNVNIKPESKVTFNLTYEELLTRRLGRYEQAININPDQVTSIKDYKIIVNIEESRNLTFVRVPSLSNDIDDQNPDGNNPDAVVDRPAPNKAKISWSPNSSDQKKLSKEGLSGKFVVQYDVDRETDAGQILVMQGYFVHFFAPENLAPLRKHVVFILDVSGSMWGRKMEQLKDAQTKILNDLSPEDFFNIITFSSDVYLWSPNDKLKKGNDYQQPSWQTLEVTPPEILARKQPLPATPENIAKAKVFIDSLIASGGTNIHDAIIEALNLTAVVKEAQKGESASSTEPITVDVPTTLLPSSSTAQPLSNVVGSSSAATTTTTTTAAAPSSASTEAASSSTTAASSDDDENRTVIIVDIAKSEPLDIFTESPEAATTVPSSNKVVLPNGVQSMIIFLTDGEPTVGVTDPPEIQRLIQTANRNLSVPIFSLGFGEGADFPFLRKLSLQNNGFGRKIYEASDAALQLKGFYAEIASPLLSNVTFNYTSQEYNVTDLTVTRFPTVFGGTEIAVAGKLVAPPKPERVDDQSTLAPSSTEPSSTVSSSSSTPELDYSQEAPSEPSRLTLGCGFEPSDRYFFDVNVEGEGRDGEVDLSNVEVFERKRCGIDIPIIFSPPPGSPFPPRPTPPPTPEDIFLERLWAYLTIQQLIEKDLAGNTGEKPEENAGSTTISPSTTLASDETSKVTQVLPVEKLSTSAAQNKTETPKEKALRLALKYGFVTPLTSLVVVKPNSSDVTNTESADAKPDVGDSFYATGKFSFQAPILSNMRVHHLPPNPIYAPQSISYNAPGSSNLNVRSSKGGARAHIRSSISRGRGRTAAGRAPQSMVAMAISAPASHAGYSGIRNKIASYPLPISSNYANFQSSLPIPFGGSQQSGIFHLANSPSDDYDIDSNIAPVHPSTTHATPTTTTTRAPAHLSLDDVAWLPKDQATLSLNQTDYMIARNLTTDSDEGYLCTVKSNDTDGKCVHLQSCVLPAFSNDESLFKSSYFCGIKSNDNVQYVGTCCPQGSRAKQPAHLIV